MFIESSEQLANKLRYLILCAKLIHNKSELKSAIASTNIDVATLKRTIAKNKNVVNANGSELRVLTIELKEAKRDEDAQLVRSTKNGVLIEINVSVGYSLQKHDAFAVLKPISSTSAIMAAKKRTSLSSDTTDTSTIAVIW